MNVAYMNKAEKERNNTTDKEIISRIRKIFVASSFVFCFSATFAIPDAMSNIGAENMENQNIDKNIKTENFAINTVSVDTQTNDMKVNFTADRVGGIIPQIFRGIEDNEGNIIWKKDDLSFVKIRTDKNNGGTFSMQFRWIAADPESPSKFFKITLKDSKGRMRTREFQVKHPNM